MVFKLVILLTGASRGIGKRLHQQLVALGHHVIAVSRSGGENNVYECDVNDTERLYDIVVNQEKCTKLNVLIHNAAIGYYGEFEKQSKQSIIQLVNTNFMAPVALTHRFHPLLAAAVAQKESAQVLFISSSHDTVPSTQFTTYTATKAALSGFARSLEREWHRENIKVLCAIVGPTKTTMHERLGMKMPPSSKYTFMEESKVAKRLIQYISKNTTGRVKIGWLSNLIQAKATVRHFFRLIRSGSSINCTKRSSVDETECILVTGAAGGIGKAFTERLSPGIVVATDRRSIETNNVFIEMDLTDFDQMNESVQRIPGQLNGVVMNAGMNVVGRFIDIPIVKHEMIIKVNFLGPILLTHAMVQNNQLKDPSWLLFMSSLSQFVGYPGAASYAAAKNGIASFSDSLGATTVFPGPTQTEMAAACSPLTTERSNSRMAPSQVADTAVRGALHGKSAVVPGFQNRFFAVLGLLFPTLMGKIMEKVIYDNIEQGIQLEVAYDS